MMLYEVVDIMNRNSLVALAYIKESANPISIFCNYILYCLEVSPNKTLRRDELVENIESEFGLHLSPHFLLVCCRILRKEKKIIIQSDSATYCVHNSTFDVANFNIQRELFRSKENGLINGLVQHAAELKQSWTYDEARGHLSSFLVTRQNAARLFTHGDVNSVDRENKIHPEWYVAKYITKVLERENDEAEYLTDVVKGLMIYIGAHQFQDFEAEKNQKFRGTNFFIDTRLLLRAMGFSWKLEVDAANELIGLIANSYNGRICAFEHTIKEIEIALSVASDELKSGKQISNLELRVFAAVNKCDAFDFEIYSNGARNKIENELKCDIKQSLDWDDENTRKYNLDWESLTKYIRDRYPMWKPRAISNDISALNSINIYRKGNYAVRFGGKDNLPIFITSSFSLVDAVRQYTLDHGGSDTDTIQWKVDALPVVSDNMIMSRLWLPKAASLSAIPTLTIARNAYAAQQASPDFYEKLRVSSRELESKHNINISSQAEVWRNKLDEIIIKNTSGNVEDITPEVIASSVEELVALKTIALQNENSVLREKDEDNILTIKTQQQQIIQSATIRLKNRIGIRRGVIYLTEKWWIINAMVWGGVSVLLILLRGNPHVVDMRYFWLLFAVMSISVKAIEKLLDKALITNILLSKSVPYVWSAYAKRVKGSLFGAEKVVEKEILQSCLNETPLFYKHIKHCEL